jgi:D-alanine-D-alanine ligase
MARSFKRTLRVTMLVDAECIDSDDPDFSAADECNSSSMERQVAAGLRRLGHRVRVIGFPANTTLASRCILSTRPDVVFNVVEEVEHDRRLSPNVPALLSLLGIPFTGCSEVGMSLALDKALSKCLVADVGFKAPRFMVYAEKALPKEPGLRFPVIVKPRFGGGSEGVTQASVVNDGRQLRARALYVHRAFRQSAICEEFVDGPELSVGLLGNGKEVEALPVRETCFGAASEGGPNFCTDIVKRSASYRARWKISYRRADLDREMEGRIQDLCRRAFQRLELSGYARMDMRLDTSGEPRFLEANPNPDIRRSVFGIMASWVGLDYETLLQNILDQALRRSSG